MPKFSSLYFLLFFLLAAPPLFARQQALTNGDIDKNIAESNAFFNRVEDLSSYQRVVNLATQIINNRQKYDNTTIAISFSLLADAAIYEGDSDSAFQFAQDGLKQGRIDRVVQLKLFTRLAAGFYAKGNYNSVLKTSTQSIFLAQDKKYLPYLLESYGYRAIANALLGHYQQAYVDLQTIDQLLDKNPQQANQLELLRILAVANLNLGDYKTSVTLHLKLLKLQFSLARKENIERTYYNLATAYLKLERYDDAYNAFWEVKKLSEKKLAPILLAYAQLGLGEVLLQQGENELAYASLIKAEKLFKGKNLNKAYLSNLIALAKVSQNTNRELFASQLLQKAERLAQRTGLTRDQIVLYKMLSSNYKKQDNYRKALRMLNKFLQLSELFKRSRVEKAELQVKAKLTTDKSRKLLLKLSEKSTLFTEFSNKNHRLLQYLWGLLLLVACLVIWLLSQWFRHKSYRLQVSYGEFEQPIYYLTSPEKTKKLYQTTYKEARKFDYPLTVTYISVINWQTLAFHFSKKIMAEVATTIATIITNNLGEFNKAGLINQGEYLLLFPHYSVQDKNKVIEQISQELKASFFVNLGEFSVMIKLISRSPTVQDIDPFAFLASLSKSLKNE